MRPKKSRGDVRIRRQRNLSGSLFASGLIAAGALSALRRGAEGYESLRQRRILNFPHTFLDNNYVSVLAFAALAFRALLLRPQAVEEVSVEGPIVSPVEELNQSLFDAFKVFGFAFPDNEWTPPELAQGGNVFAVPLEHFSSVLAPVIAPGIGMRPSRHALCRCQKHP